jgi:hypothetical protein
MSVRLSARHSEALAELLPLLLCGEESAVLTFGLHAQSASLAPAARLEFRGIQIDEARHAKWLQLLRVTLPPPRPDSRLRVQLRHFYVRMGDPDLGGHLARIAAQRGDAFELLGICPDRLFDRLLRVPRSLFA